MKQSWQRSDSDKNLCWYIGMQGVKSVKYDGDVPSHVLGNSPCVSGRVSRNSYSQCAGVETRKDGC